MARTKLTSEQKETLLTWLAADYDSRLITQWFKERGYPELTRAMLTFYRKKYGVDIEKLRAERKHSALNEGLALKEERVKRLTEHADALEVIKWVPDKNGKLWNEKAWRETLADIAAETGGRKTIAELTGAHGEPLIPKPEEMKPSEIAERVAALLKIKDVNGS